MKMNCWEMMQCGRGAGGSRDDVCPAATETKLNGVHEGKNGGRACWVIAGTQCNGQLQGTFAKKFKSCSQCKLYLAVKAEEGGKFVAVHPHFCGFAAVWQSAAHEEHSTEAGEGIGQGCIAHPRSESCRQRGVHSTKPSAPLRKGATPGARVVDAANGHRAARRHHGAQGKSSQHWSGNSSTRCGRRRASR